MILTDRNIVAAGIVDRVLESMQIPPDQVTLFDKGEPEPSLKVASQAIEVAKASVPDVMIGLGGGSNMDLAKVTALLHAHGGNISDYYGFDCVPSAVTPIIAIPTTSGTGSEVSHAAVLTDSKQELKVSTLSHHLRPCMALVDPELTLSCPANVTAESGMDALTHAIEAFTARYPSDMTVGDETSLPYPGKNPLADLLAEKAIRLISTHLETAVKQPRNMQAREAMALASTLAGLAFSNGAVAVVHALEYPLGVSLHCSHGLGNWLLLPYVMRFNRPNRLQAFAEIATFLGCDTSNLSVEKSADLAIHAVEILKDSLGIPARIRDLGASREQLPEFAKKSHGIERLMDLNPRHPSEKDLHAILQDAY